MVAAVPLALASGKFFFVDIQENQLSGRELALLRFLSSFGEVAIDQELLAHRFPDELDDSLALLLRRDLIETTDRGYRLQVELIRRWFAQGELL